MKKYAPELTATYKKDGRIIDKYVCGEIHDDIESAKIECKIWEQFYAQRLKNPDMLISIKVKEIEEN